MPATPPPVKAVLSIGPKEQAHLVFVIHAHAQRGADKAFCILTKRKADGLLDLIAYWHSPAQSLNATRNLIHAPAVPPDALIGIIKGMTAQLHLRPEDMTVLDLRTCLSASVARARLKEFDLQDAIEFVTVKRSSP